MKKDYKKPIFELVAVDESTFKFFAASANNQFKVYIASTPRSNIEL